MTGQIVELSTSELYHRHKRNLLFFSSVTIVLSLAKHENGLWKIPGVDADVVPLWGYALLGAGTIYASAQYLLEFLAVRARNAEGWAGVKASRLDEALAAQALRVESEVSAIRKVMSSFNSQLLGLSHLVNDTRATLDIAITDLEDQSSAEAIAKAAERLDLGNYYSLPQSTPPDPDPALANALARRQNFAAALDVVQRITSQVELVMTAAEEARESLEKIAERNAQLSKNFGRLSRFIHSGQRWNMTILDGWVPFGGAAIAVGICAWQIFGTLAPLAQARFLAMF